MSPLRTLSLPVLLILGMIGFDSSHAAGNPPRLGEALPDQVPGAATSDYRPAHSEYRLETGKAYRPRIIASGRK